MEREWNQFLIFQWACMKRWYQWWPGWFLHSCQQVCNRVPSWLILVCSCAWKLSSSVSLIGTWKLMTHLVIWVPQMSHRMIHASRQRHRFQLTWAAVEHIGQQVALHRVSKQPALMWKRALTCSGDWKISLHCAPGQHALEFQESQPTSRQVVQACEAEGIEGDPGKGRCSTSLCCTRTWSLHLLMSNYV